MRSQRSPGTQVTKRLGFMVTGQLAQPTGIDPRTEAEGPGRKDGRTGLRRRLQGPPHRAGQHLPETFPGPVGLRSEKPLHIGVQRDGRPHDHSMTACPDAAKTPNGIPAPKSQGSGFRVQSPPLVRWASRMKGETADVIRDARCMPVPRCSRRAGRGRMCGACLEDDSTLASLPPGQARSMRDPSRRAGTADYWVRSHSGVRLCEPTAYPRNRGRVSQSG